MPAKTDDLLLTILQILGLFGPAAILLLTRLLNRHQDRANLATSFQDIANKLVEELQEAHDRNIELQKELDDRDRVEGAGPILELIIRLRAGEKPYVESWRLEKMPPGTGPLVPKGRKAQ